jgi:hypothetical protein
MPTRYCGWSGADGPTPAVGRAAAHPGIGVGRRDRGATPGVECLRSRLARPAPTIISELPPPAWQEDGGFFVALAARQE